MKKDKIAFTLIEILVSILITSIIIIVGFEALTATIIGKAKLVDSTNIEKETFFFTQKLFEEIKKGGTLDYEEYFNRKIVGDITFSSGHFQKNTGFGNFGSGGNVGSTTYGTGFYYCRSGNGIGNKMGTGGCATNNLNIYQTSVDLKPQRYGQYSFQFIDYNINYDADLGDEDSINGIIGDDDDEYLGIGPEAFTDGTGVTELYLISADKFKRTIFRWNLAIDSNRPTSATCTITGKTFTGNGCIGTVSYLKLVGKDWGIDHNSGSIDTNGTQYDGVVDTWIIDTDFAGGSEIVVGSDNVDSYFLSLFPDSINVSDFQIFAYPNKDIKLSWKDDSAGANVSPYVRLKMKLSPSWKTKRKIKGKIPEFEINTTVSLTDIYSR